MDKRFRTSTANGAVVEFGLVVPSPRDQPTEVGEGLPTESPTNRTDWPDSGFGGLTSAKTFGACEYAQVEFSSRTYGWPYCTTKNPPKRRR